METVKSFSGLNNISDPLRLGLGWLARADNVNVSDTGAISKRGGYSLAMAGQLTSAFSTHDFARMYMVDGTALKTFDGTILKAGLSTAPMFWTEVNDQVFFSNGIDQGVILPDNTVLDWGWARPATPAVATVTGALPAGLYQIRCTFILPDGRETGTSDAAEITLAEGQALQVADIEVRAGYITNVYIAPANSEVYQRAFSSVDATAFVWNSSPDELGVDLLTALLDPLPPNVDVIQAWKGRLYAAQYLPTEDQTVIWFSEPLGFHLFDLSANFFIVPGRVRMLAPHDDALLIGTDQRIYAYSGEKLEQLAPYGVAPGQHWAEDDERVLFWSNRGLCSAMPFSNLTEQQVSVAPGVNAGGTIVQHHGQKRYVVALQQGGSAFNSYI